MSEHQEVRLMAGPADMIKPRIAALPEESEPPAGGIDEADIDPGLAPSKPPARRAASGTPAMSSLGDNLIVDQRGRRLKLRELTMLQEMDLMALAGDAKTMNRAWWLYASTAARVEAIDGVPLPFPTSDGELRVMCRRVDREGVAAVIAYINTTESGGPDQGDEALAKN